ncbi:MAG: NAD(P)-binding domain-containing protein [Acidobacteria bacterium]|nr:NAD(P)-binding domain-containing protein [Acidobacteriota bacterium]MCB9399545.1 NAD(P)-binding domain-containing protein [Acidobacteriota bacterium]
MKMGVLGSGQVGQVLAKGLLDLGHDVKIGTRSVKPELAAWSKESGVATGTFQDVAEFGEVLVFAVLGSAAEEVIQLIGQDRFKGKIVMDVTNPLAFGPQGPELTLGHTDSGGEWIQRLLPQARVVKAFNSVGNAHMVHPKFEQGPPTMFIAGNDADAKKWVSDLSQAWGWDAVDTGTIESSRFLEPLCLLWVKFGLATGTWNHAFKLLRQA